SASGLMWHSTVTVAAASSSAAAPGRSTDPAGADARAASSRCDGTTGGVGSGTGALFVVVTGVALTGFLVGIGVAGRNGTLTGACDFVVGRASACEEFLHVPRRVGHGVGDERQRRGEPHTGAGADLRAEHALGLLEAGSSGFVIGFGVQIRAADRVVDGGVVQIRGDLRVGDRHELEPRILDLEVDGGRHDGGDALRESASPCWIGHVVRSLLWPPAGGPSCGRDQSSGPYSLRLTDSRSSSGRWATSRS